MSNKPDISINMKNPLQVCPPGGEIDAPTHYDRGNLPFYGSIPGKECQWQKKLITHPCLS